MEMNVSGLEPWSIFSIYSQHVTRKINKRRKHNARRKNGNVEKVFYRKKFGLPSTLWIRYQVPFLKEWSKERHKPHISEIVFWFIILVFVQCTMYNVQCTMYNVQCTMYNVQCTMYNVQCTMYNVKCTMYNVQCTMYNVQCTMYNVQCTMYIH